VKLSNEADAALLQLLALLERDGYDFMPVTPATHARVTARPDKGRARTLRDVFGWSLPFEPDLLPPDMLRPLDAAGLIERKEGLLRSRVRVSRILDRLFVHSSFPTDDLDSVFFGPDSYRFARFVRAELARTAGTKRLVDIGAGAGVGAILAAPLLPGARLTLVDLNPAALRLARINARHAGLEVETIEGGGIEDVSDLIDLAIANPPFIMDEEDRTYRDGGGMHGAQLSFDWTMTAARRLEPRGRMLLYTGVAIIEGRDELREALERELPPIGCSLRYSEIDPDIFGEELEKRPYAGVERIAAIGAVVERGA
jgi:methylase of polypeptide subunit release factors